MQISEVFTAAQSKTYGVPGNFFRLKKLTGITSGSVSVTFAKDGQKIDVDLTAIDAGDRAEFPGGFDTFTVTSTEAQTVTMQVMRGLVGSDRITGEVSVISGERARAFGRTAFMLGIFQGATAAQYSQAQLWNPGASGKNLFLNQLEIYCTTVAVASVELQASAAALATLIGNGTNKYMGGAVSAAEVRRTAAAYPGGANLAYFSLEVISKSVFYKFTEPLCIPPGTGVTLILQPVNNFFGGAYEWFEEAVPA